MLRWFRLEVFNAVGVLSVQFGEWCGKLRKVVCCVLATVLIVLCANERRLFATSTPQGGQTAADLVVRLMPSSLWAVMVFAFDWTSAF